VKPKLVCITPIDQIPDLKSKFINYFESSFVERPQKDELRIFLLNELCEIIYTNPNQQRFTIDESLLDGTMIHTICTASTGLNHIDMKYCHSKNIKVISITKELETLKKITSTAELAFCLLLTSIRHIIPAVESVRQQKWSWEPFLGRQIKDLNIGIVGHGRLGTMFSSYCKAFGATVSVYDPYVDVKNLGYNQVENIEKLVEICDVISLHVHVSDETKYLINKNTLKNAKQNLVIINTSRGEIVDENDITDLLKSNMISHYACDVLEKEFVNNVDSPLLLLENSKVTITPHIGGSSSDAQKIAYHRAFDLLLEQYKL